MILATKAHHNFLSRVTDETMEARWLFMWWLALIDPLDSPSMSWGPDVH